MPAGLTGVLLPWLGRRDEDLQASEGHDLIFVGLSHIGLAQRKAPSRKARPWPKGVGKEGERFSAGLVRLRLFKHAIAVKHVVVFKTHLALHSGVWGNNGLGRSKRCGGMGLREGVSV